MIIILTTMIKVFALSFVITKFTPLQWFIESLEPLSKKNIVTNLIVNILSLLTSCHPCCSLWLGFILGGFWIGIFTYVLTYVYNNSILNSWEKIYVN